MADLKTLPILMASSLLLLSSCGGEVSQSSSDGSSEEPSSSQNDSSPYTMSVSDAYYEIAKTQIEEINGASSTFLREENASSRLSNVMEETYLSYQDGSTTSSGTYTKKEEGKEDRSDSFKRIATGVEETYEDASGQQTTYNMFVSALDFASDSVGTSSAYQDSASKLFILDSASEAGSLDENQYILSSDFGLYCSANLTGKLANFLASNVVDNIYAEQCGVTTVTPSFSSEGNWDYSLSFSYSYQEEGETVVSQIKASYTLDKEKKRLLSFSTSSKTTYSREGEEDEAFSLSSSSGSITYGERAKKIGDGALDPEDYFLAEVKSVGLLAQEGFKYVTVLPDSTNDGYSVPFTCSKIQGYAYKAKPEKAIDVSLTPYATSNAEIVALEEGEFVIKSIGKCSLTFAYYKKDSTTGVYKFTTVRASNVNIKTASPEKIGFGMIGQLNEELSLVKGKSYSLDYYVSPSKASSEVQVTSSNPDVLSASLQDGSLKLEAKAEGAVTLTLTSLVDPSITAKEHFYVLGDMDYVSFLISHTFYSKNVWNTELTIKFNADGTGSRHIAQNEKSEDDSFNWENEDNVLSFDFDKTPSIKEYEDGFIIGRVDDEGNFLGYGLSIGSSDYSTEVYSIID